MRPPVPDPTFCLPFLLREDSAGPSRNTALQAEVLALFEESRAGLLNYVRFLGVRDHDAEEILQDIFLALFQHLRLGRAQRNMRGWLFRVAHNLGLKQRNKARRNGGEELASVLYRQIDPEPNPEQRMNAQQRQEKLWAVFRALPEQDRCCLHLRSEGLRYRQIAEIVGISLGSVAQSLTRSLERLHRASEKS